MQDLVKRHFWVVGALTVMVSAYFVARTVAHATESAFLGDSLKGPQLEPMAKQRPTTETRRSKAGEPVAARNVFCSDCVAKEPEAIAQAPTDPNVIPETTLPLVLVATSVGPNPEASFATIQNSTTQGQGAYW